MAEMNTHQNPNGITTGIRTRSISDDRLEFISQIGVQDIYIDHSSLEEDPDDYVDNTNSRETLVVDADQIPDEKQLKEAKEQIERFDLRLAGIHSIPHSLYGPIMFGGEKSEERIGKIIELIRNLGSADIPILGYQWNPRGLVPMRTSDAATIRGGAKAPEFDLSEIESPFETAETVSREYTTEEFWVNYTEFVESVIPIAEEENVRLALHPADPPGYEQLGGIPRLFNNVESFERAMDIVQSDAHGLKLCLGCFSQLGEDIPSLIRKFGDRNDIIFVHFRDVEGTVPNFRETFVDEGNYDGYQAMKALEDVGFSGSVVPDHVPQITGDTQWRHRANAYTIGYFKGLIEAVSSY